ncbi:MAG TPA: circadian clock protein KaiC [Burkholderiales bacterium]|nr:circadian clock protein KaiC [Burkholderiales bacterium]
MPSVRSSLGKAPTGITGFDSISAGGLPRGRTTLLLGEPGSGKTVLALQFLVHGVQDCNEPGIFVAFEETSKRIVVNAESFGWKLAELRRNGLFFMDAQPLPDMVQAGDFDLSGMLAALGARTREMGARRIVFDALNVTLALLPDAAAQRRELCRLNEWLSARDLTGLITLQAGVDDTGSVSQQPFGFMQFMVDCVVLLGRRVVQGVSQRNLRVQKYRGSGFDEDEAPFLIGDSGLEVAVARAPDRAHAKVSIERVSSGVKRLDTMLGGGYYRGASVLISGSPGTAKTTLSATFAEAACRRGERTLFVSFGSERGEVIRNMASVGIRLDRYVKSGCLRMIPARTITGGAEIYLSRIKSLAQQHGARCLVIDSVSTWSKSDDDATVRRVAERLTDWAKAGGITLVCTMLLDEMSGWIEGGSPLHLAILADTWIHLNYLVRAGERNRGLSIVKSRGTAHSNQVRELILGDAGVTLADTYSAGGEVLMGTLRWEKENAERAASNAKEVSARLKRVRLDAEEAELGVQLKSLQVELEAKQVEQGLLLRSTETRKGELSRGRSQMRELRGADAAKRGRR